MRRIINAIAMLTALGAMLFPAHVRAEDRATVTSASAPLELVRTITVGGMPDSVVVDTWRGRNDVLFYDLASGKVKVLDGDSLQLTSDEVHLPHWGFDSWMSYDPSFGHTYVLTVSLRDQWQELAVHVLNRRTLVKSFSVNEQFNANAAVDGYYTVAGYAAKPAYAEIDQLGRLIIDNVRGGNLDVVDIDATGLKPRSIQRFSYRAPLASPTIRTFKGSSLALEPKHETTTTDDLAHSDLLYLMDGNTSDERIRTLQMTHGPGSLAVTERAAVDFSGIWPFTNGVQGLFVNGPADQLLVGSALQSFDDGFAASVRTTGTTVETLKFRYCDPGFLLADWYDQKRIFVTAFDDFWNDPDSALYLRLLYGLETYSLILESQFTELPDVRDMAFDPYHRRLYVAAEDKIYVVQVNVGAGTAPLPEPRPAAATTILFSPWYGGTLEAPEGRAEVVFMPGSVDAETEVAYAETLYAPATGPQIAARAFHLTATETETGDPVTDFLKPFHVTLKYTDRELFPVDEATCGLYRWNGSRWVRVSAAAIDRAKNEITVSLDHMSIFAILGEIDGQVYLPAIER